MMSYKLHFLFKKMEENGPFVDREKTQHGRIWDLVPFYPPVYIAERNVFFTSQSIWHLISVRLKHRIRYYHMIQQQYLPFVLSKLLYNIMTV